jgi:hypothetical protein
MWHLSKNSKDEKERRMFQIKRKSRKGWTNQSKVYPQWGYIETPLWTMT